MEGVIPIAVLKEESNVYTTTMYLAFIIRNLIQSSYFQYFYTIHSPLL